MTIIEKRGTSLTTLEGIFLRGIRLQRHGILKKLWKLQGIGRHAIAARSRRRKFQKRKRLKVPAAIAFSPTMRCDLSCVGCYALDYPRDDELSLDTIDGMLESAENMGVFLFIITGGEPLMRDGILDVFQRHRRLLFLLITNGKLLDRKMARKIAGSRNILPVVSLEGSREQTDVRRGHGVYDQVERAMTYLQSEGVAFGFSATVARDNFEALGSDEFVEEMIRRGCALGFYTEYIPVGREARWELVLEDEEQKEFRKRILELRKNKPIMIAHLPDDEYGDDDRCKAVVYGSVHINAQGYVEPCPFTHFAADNIREKGLEEILRSQFLDKLRSSDAILRRGRIGCAILRRGRIGCALFENREILEEIAAKAGAEPTDCLRGS
jgi:MoaA/NifB/PqqE/SkfB family radical SAM enzyme